MKLYSNPPLTAPSVLSSGPMCTHRARRAKEPSRLRALDGEFGNKMATTLAMSTQCDRSVNQCKLNRKSLRFNVFQRQPSVFAM